MYSSAIFLCVIDKKLHIAYFAYYFFQKWNVVLLYFYILQTLSIFIQCNLQINVFFSAAFIQRFWIEFLKELMMIISFYREKKHLPWHPQRRRMVKAPPLMRRGALTAPCTWFSCRWSLTCWGSPSSFLSYPPYWTTMELNRSGTAQPISYQM